MILETNKYIRIEIPDSLDVTELEIEQILHELRGTLVQVMPTAALSLSVIEKEQVVEQEKKETVVHKIKAKQKTKTG